ncbi:hypothetical protein ACWCOW_37475 [Streptomyces sp. NPDC001939]
MVVEGAPRVPDSEGHYDTGWDLYQALAKNCQLHLYDFLAVSEHLVGERSAPALGCEGQVGVEAVDDRAALANMGVWRPAW